MKKSKLKKLLDSPNGLSKIAQAMLAPLKRDLVYTKRVSNLFKTYLKPCAKCRLSEIEHFEIKDHEFFHNNLEMLEWESKRREHV